MDRDQVEELVTASDNPDGLFAALNEENFYSDNTSQVTNEEDVYTALTNRERDLKMAAELGKALLEKNEELKRQKEHLSEEYRQEIEKVTQERYGLKLKLENLDEEYQATVRELQNDITTLQRALEEKQHASEKQCSPGAEERRQQYAVEELTAQNQQLRQQLQESSEGEKQLRRELRDLQEELGTRLSSGKHQATSLEAVNQQMDDLCEKKAGLERRIESLVRERDALLGNLEEYRDRIADLEQENQCQKSKLADCEKSMLHLQERACQLQDRLSAVNRPANHSSEAEEEHTLFSELQMSGLAQAMSTESLDQSGAVRIGQQEDAHSSPFYFYNTCHVNPSLLFDEDDNIECDDEAMEFPAFMEFPQLLMTSSSEFSKSPAADNEGKSGENQHLGVVESRMFDSHTEDYNLLGCKGDSFVEETVDYACESEKDYRPESPGAQSHKTETSTLSGESHNGLDEELRQEILEVYRQLHHLVMELRGTVAHWSPETIQLSDMKPGSLLTVLKDLRDVVLSLHQKQDSTSLSDDLQDYLEHQDMKIQDLRRDVAEKATEVTKVTEELKVKDAQIKRYMEQVQQSQKRISEQHICIQRLQNQLDSVLNGKLELSGDAILLQTRSERDLGRKELLDCEHQLDQLQSSLRQLDGQLLEAVQRKLELQQQLELWQVDMQDLIDKQVSRRLREDRQSEEKRLLLKKQQQQQELESQKTKSSKTRFSLFSRSKDKH